MVVLQLLLQAFLLETLSNDVEDTGICSFVLVDRGVQLLKRYLDVYLRRDVEWSHR